MLLYFTRVDDVMCFNIYQFCLWFTKKKLAANVGEKGNLAKQNGEITFQFGSH